MSATSALGKAADSASNLAASSARGPNNRNAAGEMTIGEMAREFGVTLRTLRFYEDRNLIRPRRAGNARYYGGADRVRLEMILKGKQLGFTLSEISDLIGGRGQRGQDATSRRGCGRRRSSIRLDHLERQRHEIDEAISRLKATRERLSRIAGAA